ncbi:MAG: (deoxy)nucleoside triphosphate pyrophosphohydrolase [Candidatus Omnitrophica bacterium]|nr:(deoxy)nucleoside triphosphate pyrophosphohydrolase [Candidatus Omnitrophota bacterium]
MPKTGAAPRRLVVAVAVIQRGRKVLITQRMLSDSFGGMWEFPGGKKQAGESLERCLVREIKEELGLAIRVAGRINVVEHRYPTCLIRMTCFDCRVLAGEPKPLECADLRWVLPGELSKYRFPPASGPIIRHLLQKEASCSE